MFSRGNLGAVSRGGEFPRLSYLSRTGEIYRSLLIGGGERRRRSSIGDGSRTLFKGAGDRAWPKPMGDLEYLRTLGGGDLIRSSLRGEYARGGDLGRPLKLPIGSLPLRRGLRERRRGDLLRGRSAPRPPPGAYVSVVRGGVRALRGGDRFAR